MAHPQNIGTSGRQRRLVIGVVLFAASVAALAALILLDAPRAVRLGLVVPFWIAALYVAQARAGI